MAALLYNQNQIHHRLSPTFSSFLQVEPKDLIIFGRTAPKRSDVSTVWRLLVSLITGRAERWLRFGTTRKGLPTEESDESVPATFFLAFKASSRILARTKGGFTSGAGVLAEAARELLLPLGGAVLEKTGMLARDYGKYASVSAVRSICSVIQAGISKAREAPNPLCWIHDQSMQHRNVLVAMPKKIQRDIQTIYGRLIRDVEERVQFTSKLCLLLLIEEALKRGVLDAQCGDFSDSSDVFHLRHQSQPTQVARSQCRNVSNSENRSAYKIVQ